MNREEHLLTVAGEECSETHVRISKALRFGLDQIQEARDDKPEQNPERLTNRERILEEFFDLCAVLDMAHLIRIDLHSATLATTIQVPRAAILAKQAKVEHYLKTVSAVNGTLTV
jgi:hypothetical protein